MDIGEVAQRSGIPVSTLRLYDEKGLISSIGRRGLRRLLDSAVLERLAPIAADVGSVRRSSLPSPTHAYSGADSRHASCRRLSAAGQMLSS